MATNPFFSQGRKSEQLLYEDLVVESLKFYGQDIYYLPREIVNRDMILNEDVPSRFENAYAIEMYISTVDGFEGDGDLFTKFGVEIRDAATFIVSRRRWGQVVESSEESPFYRPREGDLIYLPLSNSIFQIMRVQDESPFYQLKNLPVYTMTCELFEYGEEDFDTGIAEIDQVETTFAYHKELTLTGVTGTFTVGEEITQVAGTYTLKGEVMDWNGVTNVLRVGHIGADDGMYHEFSTAIAITGTTSGATGTPSVIGEDIQRLSQNEQIETYADGILDFTESNPFGDP